METKNEQGKRKTIDRVYGILKTLYRGEKNAVSADDLSLLFGISKRELRKIRSEINSSYQYDGVISTSGKIYFCETDEEVVQAVRSTYSAAFTLLKKARKMEKELSEQGQFYIDRFCKQGIKDYTE